MNEKSNAVVTLNQVFIGVCQLGNEEPLVCNSKAGIVQFDNRINEKPIPKKRVVLCNYGGKATCRFRHVTPIEIGKDT